MCLLQVAVKETDFMGVSEFVSRKQLTMVATEVRCPPFPPPRTTLLIKSCTRCTVVLLFGVAACILAR